MKIFSRHTRVVAADHEAFSQSGPLSNQSGLHRSERELLEKLGRTSTTRLRGRQQPKPKKKRNSLDLRSLIVKQGNTCVYCQRSFSLIVVPTREHIIPKARGGTDSKANVAAACLLCNGDKGDKLVSEWTNRWYHQKGKNEHR